MLALHLRNELIRLALPYSTDGVITSELKAFTLDLFQVTTEEQTAIMLEEQERNTAYVNGGTA